MTKIKLILKRIKEFLEEVNKGLEECQKRSSFGKF